MACPESHHEVLVEIALCLPPDYALMPPSHLQMAVEATLGSVFVKRRLEKKLTGQLLNIDP